MDGAPLGADLGEWPAGLEMPGAGAEAESAHPPPPYRPVLVAPPGGFPLGGRVLLALSRAVCGALHGAAGARGSLAGAAFSPGIEMEGYRGEPSCADSGCWVYNLPSGGGGSPGVLVLCQHGLGGGLAGPWVETMLGALAPAEVVVLDCILGAPPSPDAPPMLGIGAGVGAGAACSPVGSVQGLFPVAPAGAERLADGAAEVLRWAAARGVPASVLVHSQALPVPGGADVHRVAAPAGAALRAFLGVDGDTAAAAAAAAAGFDKARAGSAAQQVYI